MIVGLDYRSALWSRSGISRYTRELGRAFAAGLDARDDLELRLYGDCLRRRGVDPDAEPLPPSPWVSLHARRIPARLALWLARSSRAGIARRLGPIDLFHCTDYVALPLGSTPHIVTIHDLSFLEDASFHGSERAARLEQVTRSLLERARAVIAPSEFTAAALVLRMGIAPAMVHVVPHGADHAPRIASKTPAQAAPRRPVTIVTLGTLEPRKNHLRCLGALERLHAEGLELRWEVLGARGWLYEPFLEALDRSPLRPQVLLRDGGISDREAMGRLRDADLLLYPSLAEGFGLPVIEAMALGTAVLTSSISATAEIAGDAALLVDPRDEDALVVGLRTLLLDPAARADLSAAGLQRAASLTWRACATSTLQVYHRTLSSPPRQTLSRLF